MTAFYARTLFCEKFMKTMETIKCQRINSCTLTTDVDDNNNPFVFASNGNATFGYLPNNEIFTYTHVKLSIGENRIDEHTGKNHGYGLLHIEARHGKEIRSFGFKSCCEFLIYILANPTTIKEGKVINNMRTYFIDLTLTMGHPNQKLDGSSGCSSLCSEVMSIIRVAVVPSGSSTVTVEMVLAMSSALSTLSAIPRVRSRRSSSL